MHAEQSFRHSGTLELFCNEGSGLSSASTVEIEKGIARVSKWHETSAPHSRSRRSAE